jgi:hypothetical protein
MWIDTPRFRLVVVHPTEKVIPSVSPEVTNIVWEGTLVPAFDLVAVDLG